MHPCQPGNGDGPISSAGSCQVTGRGQTTDQLRLSGERVDARYVLTCAADDVEARARAICVEQTVEFPEALITRDDIRRQIIGEVAEITVIDDQRFAVRIRYPIEAAGSELTQLINLLFGNVSLQPGVRLVAVGLPPVLAGGWRGPRFGVRGLRRLLDIDDRPLLCTALKPMGLSPLELADLAYRLALGGIDLIKDDHGLSDQPFCPFGERVARCAEAVRRAAQETGRACLYLPNVTAPADQIIDRARRAREAGAGGLLVCPGLTGFDAMRRLADDDGLALPILAHPAFLGSLTVGADAGLGHGLAYGTLPRLAGADATIFPSFGGRFSFTREQCEEIVAAAREPAGPWASIFPVPAGGMRLERVGELRDVYGDDCILLIGGDLHAQGEDLLERCRTFVRLSVARRAPAPSVDRRSGLPRDTIAR
jgi:ribulose-bisphosphate carboxylase large chain